MCRLIFALMAAVLLGGGSPAGAAVARSLAPAEVMTLLAQQQQQVFVLDVRTVEEYRQGHLDGAHLIPIDQIASRLAEIPRDRPIVVYCAVGSRSAQVFNFLARRGYAEVYNLDGGIQAWAARGYPVRR